jgi:hypothetical protein
VADTRIGLKQLHVIKNGSIQYFIQNAMSLQQCVKNRLMQWFRMAIKRKVEKKGMDDEIRDGFDYEMTIAFEIANDKHMAISTKDRTRLFTGLPEFVITEETGKQILEWCETGLSIDDMIKDAIKKLGKCDTISDLTLLKETLNPKVRTDENFKEAAIMRFNEINNKTKQAQTA